MLQRNGDYDGAIAEYRKAYELEPRPGLHFNIGQCHRLKGDVEPALNAYRAYLRADPSGEGSALALQYVAMLEQQLNATMPEPPAPTVPPLPEPPPEPGTLRIAGVALGGTGLAGIVLGVLYGLKSHSAANDIDHATAWTPDVQARYAEGQSAQRNMYLATGLGIAAVATGAVLYFLGRRDDSGPRMDANVAHGSATFSLMGHF